MGPIVWPRGLCGPSFVRPHSVRAWSGQHTTSPAPSISEGVWDWGRGWGIGGGVSSPFRPEVKPAREPSPHPSKACRASKARCPWQQLSWPHFLQRERGLFLELRPPPLGRPGKENMQLAESRVWWKVWDTWDPEAFTLQHQTPFSVCSWPA